MSVIISCSIELSWFGLCCLQVYLANPWEFLHKKRIWSNPNTWDDLKVSYLLFCNILPLSISLDHMTILFPWLQLSHRSGDAQIFLHPTHCTSLAEVLFNCVEHCTITYVLIFSIILLFCDMILWWSFYTLSSALNHRNGRLVVNTHFCPVPWILIPFYVTILWKFSSSSPKTS